VSFLINPYVYAGAVSEAIMGGGYGSPTTYDDFYTWNPTTDTFTTITLYSTTTYGGGGCGSNTEFFNVGGYSASVTQRTEEWNGTAWSTTGNIGATSGNQGAGGGTSADGFMGSQGMVSYGTQSTYYYASGSWSSGNNLTYYNRQCAQGGTGSGTPICISGYGGTSGGSSGAGERPEANVRSSGTSGTWSAITNTSHQCWGTGQGMGGDASDFTYTGGYTTSGTNPSNENTNWNGSAYTALTVMTTGKYSTVGCGGNSVDDILSCAGVDSGGYTNNNIFWDGSAWSTKTVYPQTNGYGAGGLTV